MRDDRRDHYAANASRYGLLMRPFAHVRARAIAELHLTPGATVLELGCGTGTSFPGLLHAIGPQGRVIGVDRSPAMLGEARRLIGRQGWRNVALVQADAASLAVQPESVDAVLVVYANNVLTSPAAIAAAVRALRPGGRVAIAGARLTTRWHGLLLNALTRAYANPSLVTPLDDRPWRTLELTLGPLAVVEFLLGSAFVAAGTRR